MKTRRAYGTRIVKGFAVCTIGLLSACSSTVSTEGAAESLPVHGGVVTAPGVVQYVWEEPMVDVIDVPPGLDPEGIYYRPAHQAVVEIRQGRWQYHGEKEQ